MKAGKYKVRAKGHGASFMPMEVTLSDNKIEKIEVDAQGETKGVADEVFHRLPAEIVKNQTLNVDAVSGATISSHGVIDGISQAIDEAGGDSNEWKKRPKPSNHKQADSELTADVLIIGAGGAGLSAAARAIELGKKVIILEKYPQIGGNTARAGGPMNAAEPDWQKNFECLPGEKETLKQLIEIPISEIDKEYQADFKKLQKQIQKYLDSGANYLFDSVLLHEIQTYLGKESRP